MRKFSAKSWVRTLTGVAACLFAATAVQAEPFKVRLDWTPWGNHAAFHLADQKGWYEEAGLDIEFEDGNGSVTTVQIIGSSDNFDAGHAALAPMMIARDKGLPVKAVAPFVRRNDIGVLVPKDSGMKGPADLKGKKLVYTAGSLEAPFVDGFLAAGDLTRDDVELLNVEAAGKVTTYAVDRADAVVSTIPFVLASVQKQRPSNAIPFADYGLNMPSFGILASESKLKSRGEDISKFASVTARTWEYIMSGHEDEAVEAIMAARPQARLDKEVLRGQIEALKTYFGKPVEGFRTGQPIPAEWEEAVQTLTKVGLIEKNLPATDFYVTDMVNPGQYDGMIKK
ncbi:MAG TPA: hypothetical protein DIS96_18920 [Pusillimonas sp.]|nr:hypothetical protein [Pusillimonas sp.]|tara:strand:+ start:100758 stop:101777 length:1020 start_codon:yes stop_codon:yes gene_type:complete